MCLCCDWRTSCRRNHHVGSWDWTQVVMIGSKCQYPLNLLSALLSFSFLFLFESASDSWLLGLKVCTSMLSFQILFSNHKTIIVFYSLYSSFNLYNYSDSTHEPPHLSYSINYLLYKNFSFLYKNFYKDWTETRCSEHACNPGSGGRGRKITSSKSSSDRGCVTK